MENGRTRANCRPHEAKAGKGGAGGVARSKSTYLGTWSKPLLEITDPLIVEALALREGVLFAHL
jgi:hypothetical protein